MPSTEYNATVTFGRKVDEDAADRALDALIDYGAVVTEDDQRRMQIVLTVPASGVPQAATTSLALAASLELGDVVALSIQTTEDYDSHDGSEYIPPLLSVTEVAEQLGLTTQAIRARVSAGTMPARRVGDLWVIPAAAVDGK